MSSFVSVLKAMSEHLPEWLWESTFVRTKDGKLCQHSDGGLAGELEEADPQDALMLAALVPGTEDWGCENGRYRTLIDLDARHVYIPSTTGGHGHLIVDTRATKQQHDNLLKALVEAGVIAPGNYRSGHQCKQGSTLRLPWVKKGEDRTLADQLQSGRAAGNRWRRRGGSK